MNAPNLPRPSDSQASIPVGPLNAPNLQTQDQTGSQGQETTSVWQRTKKRTNNKEKNYGSGLMGHPVYENINVWSFLMFELFHRIVRIQKFHHFFRKILCNFCFIPFIFKQCYLEAGQKCGCQRTKGPCSHCDCDVGLVCFMQICIQSPLAFPENPSG